MKEQMSKSLEELTRQWEVTQKTSILDGAEDAATLLEHKFYVFIGAFKEWFQTLEKFTSLADALNHPDIEGIVASLPEPLYLPFENELDLLVDGILQENDEKYD